MTTMVTMTKTAATMPPIKITGKALPRLPGWAAAIAFAPLDVIPDGDFFAPGLIFVGLLAAAADTAAVSVTAAWGPDRLAAGTGPD